MGKDLAEPENRDALAVPPAQGMSLMLVTTNSARLVGTARADGSPEPVLNAAMVPGDNTSTIARDQRSFDIYTRASVAG